MAAAVFFVLLFMLCRKIFRFSAGFQKPILFDTVTERERQTDMERLAHAVETQTLEIAALTALLRREKES